MNEKMRNLLIRTATGVVFVAIVLAAMMLGRGTYLVLLLSIAAGCTVEFWRLYPAPLQKWLGTLYIFVCMAAMWFFPLIGAGMAELPSGGGEGFLSGELFPSGWDMRIAPVFVIIVWANDTFAYLTGTTLGRNGKHKLCERLSPNKTWEGFVGGVVGAVVVAAVMGRFWMDADVWLWAAFGLVVALAAVAGDLFESHFKRLMAVKDSGRMFPGHGGWLDRFDAMLGAIPVAFLFFLITFLTR
jgi:CDP-diglyceride synthetase